MFGNIEKKGTNLVGPNGNTSTSSATSTLYVHRDAQVVTPPALSTATRTQTSSNSSPTKPNNRLNCLV